MDPRGRVLTTDDEEAQRKSFRNLHLASLGTLKDDQRRVVSVLGPSEHPPSGEWKVNEFVSTLGWSLTIADGPRRPLG